MDYEVHRQARDANATLAAEAARMLASSSSEGAVWVLSKKQEGVHQSEDPDDEDFFLVSNGGVAHGWL